MVGYYVMVISFTLLMVLFIFVLMRYYAAVKRSETLIDCFNELQSLNKQILKEYSRLLNSYEVAYHVIDMANEGKSDLEIRNYLEREKVDKLRTFY